MFYRNYFFYFLQENIWLSKSKIFQLNILYTKIFHSHYYTEKSNMYLK